MRDHLVPVAEFPRCGTHTLEELREQRLSLAQAFDRGGFRDQLEPVYRRLLPCEASDA